MLKRAFAAVFAAVGLGVILSNPLARSAGATESWLPKRPAGDAATPVVVIELFTSEGCSSCPPADALLAEIDRDMREAGYTPLTLAFHVDYWNRLGWTDRFSSGAYSERQQRYATALRASGLYTPQ